MIEETTEVPNEGHGALADEPSSKARGMTGLRRVGRLFWNGDERRLRAFWRLVAHSLLTLAVMVSLGVFLVVVSLVAVRFAPAHERWLASLRDLGAHLTLGTALQCLAATLASWVCRRVIDRRSWASLGLERNRFLARDMAFGIALSGAMLATTFVILLGFGFLRVEKMAWEGTSPTALLIPLAQFGAIFVCVGWYEELVSRGYWFFNLRDGIGPWTAAIVSSSIFALGHVGNPSATLASTLALIGAGLLLAWCVVRTGQLWMAIGMHIGWNFFEGPVFGFPVSGMETFALIEHEVTGPPLLTGGAFGPEAGLLLLAIQALGAVAVFGVTRGRGARELVDPDR